MTTYSAILINPFEQTITEVEVEPAETTKQIDDLLSSGGHTCTWFEGHTYKGRDSLYVDASPGVYQLPAFKLELPDYRGARILHGKALILGSTTHGNLANVKSTLVDLELAVTWTDEAAQVDEVEITELSEEQLAELMGGAQ